MFSRVVLGLGLALAVVGLLPAVAHAQASGNYGAAYANQQAQLTQAVSAAAASQQYVLLAQTLQAQAIANESTFQYARANGGDPYSSRESWQDLRLRGSFSSRQSGSRLITAPRAPAVVRTPIRYQPNAGRVGGLGRQISGGEPSISLHGVEAGAAGSTPSFGNLHEGGESFSFSKP